MAINLLGGVMQGYNPDHTANDRVLVDSSVYRCQRERISLVTLAFHVAAKPGGKDR